MCARIRAVCDCLDARVVTSAGDGELEQIQFVLGHVSVETAERYLGLQTNCAARILGRTTLLIQLLTFLWSYIVSSAAISSMPSHKF
jgi:hypothetical protein